MSKVIQLGKYKGIEVHVPPLEVTEEDVQQEVQRLLSQGSRLVEKEGCIENGDVATIDFEGFKDGVPFEGGKGENHQLEIGSHTFIPGFEEQMIGMKKGESKALALTFPHDYHVADLAGADVIFQVKVHHIARKEKAELDEEFIASFQITDMKTPTDFYEKVKDNLLQQKEHIILNEKENQIFNALIENSQVDVEEADIQMTLEKNVEYVEQQLAQQGIQLTDYLTMMKMDWADLHEQLRPNAIKQAKLEAIIDAIVLAEHMTVSDHEVEQQIDFMSREYHQDKADLMKKIDLEGLKRDLKRVQASQLVLNSACVIEE